MSLSEEDLFEAEGIIHELVEELDMLDNSLYELQEYLGKDPSLHETMLAEIKNGGMGEEAFNRLGKFAEVLLKLKEEKVDKPKILKQVLKRKRHGVSKEITTRINGFVTAIDDLADQAKSLDGKFEEDRDFDSHVFLLSQLYAYVGEEKLKALKQMCDDALDSDMRCPK